jgi:flagellar P-ring protein precursor FlgI
VTPLIGADGEVYAVGQGPVAIAGFSAEGQAATATRGTPTVGRISNGAIIEREVVYEIASKQNLRLALRNPDFTTGRRIANAINAFLGSNSAELRDPATISLTLPANYGGNIVELLTDIEQLRVDPDMAARIVIDESSGIIVMGQDVRVSTVAIAQGNLTVTVTENAQVSQPDAPLTDGVTVFVPRTDVAVTEEDRNGIAIIENGVTLQELVDGLNALGISPRDMIAILQAIKAAGALQAEIEVM